MRLHIHGKTTAHPEALALPSLRYHSWFINLDLPHLERGDARERLQSLVDRLQELNRDAEIPSPGAWSRAKKAIGAAAQRYETDE